MKQLRPRIQGNLVKEYDRLLYPSLDYLKLNFGLYRRVCFGDLSANNMPPRLDFESCLNFMLDSRADASGIKLGFKIADGYFFGENEIGFPFTSGMPLPPFFGTEDYWSYLEWRNDLEYTCLNEFWNEKGQYLNKPYSVEIFDDRILNKDERRLYEKTHGFLYNRENWLEFMSMLVMIYFPEYEFSQTFSTKKMRRHLMELKEGIWFGFEYDQSSIVNELRNGVPEVPDSLNLILLNASFKRGENVSDYYSHEHASIISLGILGNPFFYRPCYPSCGYSAVDRDKRHREGNGYLSHIIEHGNDEYQIIHPKAYADSMKKHALFYMDVLSDSANIYLDYIKAVLSNVV